MLSDNRLILLCLSILTSLRAFNFVIYLFIYLSIRFFFTDFFSLAQHNPIENHYANIFKT